MDHEREPRQRELQVSFSARLQFDPEAVVTTCPNCSARLQVRRCKLVCPRCHYYMSCAEYY